MGRTVLPFSQVLEKEVQEWRKFRRGLRKEDQQFLDRLFEEARLHVQAGVYASRPWPFETILISILLENLTKRKNGSAHDKTSQSKLPRSRAAGH